MRALSTALFQAMAADGQLVAKLGTFGAGPSIFTKRPVPTEAVWPIVLATSVVSDANEDMLVEKGRSIQRDIAVYGNAPDHFDKVTEASEIIRNMFHRTKALVVTGWRTVLITATGPIDAPIDNPQEVGRIVTLTIRLHEP
jgi:hypothetical protein